MKHEDLGPAPDPVIEEKEANPGGVDAIGVSEVDETLGRDLSPDDNPAVDDAVPDEIVAPDEDKSQSPDGAADDAESGTQHDPPAGEVAEDGSVEPPA